MNGRDLRIVERMAKAIRLAVLRQNRGLLGDEHFKPWAAIPERLKNYYRAEACAAFHAYREVYEEEMVLQ